MLQGVAMTTKMIRIDESYEDKLADFIRENSEHMEIIEDENLVYDTYFYERKAHLDATIDAIDSGTMKIYSENESNHKIEKLREKLTQNYAN